MYLAGKLHLFDKQGYAVQYSVRGVFRVILTTTSRLAQSMARTGTSLRRRTRRDLAYNGLPPCASFSSLVSHDHYLFIRSVFYSADHWHDVLAGSILGLVLAYFSYRQYYPSLASASAHRPYAPRIRTRSQTGPVSILPTHRHTDTDGSIETGTGGAHVGPPYHDEGSEEELEAVPPGTVPRPERSSMENLWKGGNVDDDEEDVAEETLGRGSARQ